MQVGVHVCAVREHLAHRGAGNQSASGAAVALARLHVVRVEKVGVSFIQRLVVGVVRAQDERLEKPAYMRQVPFRRAYIFHRLDDVILRDERLAERFSELPDGPVALGPRG